VPTSGTVCCIYNRPKNGPGVGRVGLVLQGPSALSRVAFRVCHVSTPTCVWEYMTDPVVSIQDEACVEEGIRLMDEAQVRHLPVTGQNQLVGHFDADLLRCLHRGEGTNCG